MLALTSVASALGAFSTASVARAPASAPLIRAVPTVDQHGVENRSPLPVRRRLREPAMNMGVGGYPGNGQGGNFWHDASPGFERSAAARAARRAQQRAGRPAQPAPKPQSYPPQFSPPMPRPAEPVYEPPAADLYEPAWVLIFNEGQDNEGVYTHSEQGGSDSLLAFENLHDAEHFAQVLQTKGFDLATPLHWSGRRLTTFCARAGLEMNLVGHNDLPQPPSERRQEEFDELDNPERLSPADPVRQSQQEYYKQWLENLFSVDPNCGDDDCVLPDEDM